MMNIFSIAAIVDLHRDSLEQWREEQIDLKQEGFLRLVEQNHAFNFQLWQAEDKARREDMGYEFVYRAKRKIDYYNQQRNNYMEAIDNWLFEALRPASNEDCPRHSETPGMMIDRLSILALKIYHMRAQTKRLDASEMHRAACQTKWLTLTSQQNQLRVCLEQLIQEVLAQTRTFQLYRQFKMYNDPNLNPQLYQPSEIE